MRSNFSYWFTDFAVKMLTFDSFIFKRLIRSRLQILKINSVLDIGCGTGTQAPLFSKSKYLGFDIDPGSIVYAKRLHSGYYFIVKDATDFRLNRKFDFILVVGVLHHLNDKEMAKSLSNMKRHLKTNGELLIIEAIPPLLKWNFIGLFLRSRDRGSYIRRLPKYKELIRKQFEIDICKNVYGGVFDYAFITCNHKKNKSTA